VAVVSPCVGICALDPATRLCRGCKRTLEEIAGWISMSDDQRLAVIAALPARPMPLLEKRVVPASGN